MTCFMDNASNMEKVSLSPTPLKDAREGENIGASPASGGVAPSVESILLSALCVEEGKTF